MNDINLIESNFEILDNVDCPEKMIERAGRVCYKSEDKITETSAQPFVDRMIANKHYAMLEHGTIFLHRSNEYEGSSLTLHSDGRVEHSNELEEWIEKFRNNKYSRVYIHSYYSDDKVHKNIYVTTNLRVLVENGWLDDRKYECEFVDGYHSKRITVHFTLDIGVGREFTRHRVFSFAQESTRYCNYVKEKFGGNCTFIKPEWFDKQLTDKAKCEFIEAMEDANRHYNNLISYGLTAQQARQVLPLATKSELVMTGFISDWCHFFDLRALGTTGAPHPDAKLLAEPLYEAFKIQGII